MQIHRHIRIDSPSGRPFLLDAFYLPHRPIHSAVVFAHGFKGFKDWGHWNQLAVAFAREGHLFVKFNFAYNGTGLDDPEVFSDLEAFGQNNFSKEMADLEAAVRWVDEQAPQLPGIQLRRRALCLIGHSRGGALAICAAARLPAVTHLITWASVSRLDYAWTAPGFLQSWKEQRVYHVVNGRTGQQMPVYYQLYEDFDAHRDQFDVPAVLPALDIPFLIVHGDADPAVPAEAARELLSLRPGATLLIIRGGDHVFGGRHPFTETELPPPSLELLTESLSFLRAQSDAGSFRK